MMQEMYWACVDTLILGAQLERARDLPTPDVLQRRIGGVLEQMAEKARAAGVSEDDVAETRYALVAFLDERLLSSEWTGKQAWQARPLQLVYFNENTAGEGFFTRLKVLLSEPQRAHVLQIYYLCLTLGFRGQYALRGGEGLAQITQQAGSRIVRLLPPTDVLSPHGEPENAVRSLVRREAPVVAASIGLFVLALLVFFGLKLVLSASTSSSVEAMRKLAPVSAER